jgi:signal transduction histidine kinase
MTRKLLDQTLRTYLLYSIGILVVSAPVFYFISSSLYLDETDEALLLHKKEFNQLVALRLKQDDVLIWNKCNRDVKILPFRPLNRDSLFNKTYLDSLENENEPYRELNAIVSIEGKPYIYSEKTNLVESEDLVESVVGLFLCMIVSMLSGLIIITRRLSIKLWKPFYHTLDLMEGFEIDKEKSTSLPESQIEEFNRLNQSILQLINRNHQIFKSQKEFVENAAHELQTPLAVFQAKLDVLMQESGYSEAQYEILNSLNENLSRLNRLNRNLLLLSKLDNESSLQKEKIYISERIEKYLPFFKEQAQPRNLSFDLHLGNNREILANAALFDVLLRNLLLNAVRHNQPNGSIHIELFPNRLYISNTGKTQPLSPEQLFQRFSKSDSSETGTGLGLAIVKRITELHRWSIEYTFKNNLHIFLIRF